MNLYTGEQLCSIRSKTGLTQAELSKILDIAQKTISVWENQKNQAPEIGSFATLVFQMIERAIEQGIDKQFVAELRKSYFSQGVLGLIKVIAQYTQLH